MSIFELFELLDAKMLHGRVKVGARNYAKADKPYRPSSGTEGMAFDELWCSTCARDAEWRETENNPCPILSNTFIYNIDDLNYPKEWVYNHDGKPCCTAFTADPKKPLRCDKTPDLFS